jgi:hypothetical protein
MSLIVKICDCLKTMFSRLHASTRIQTNRPNQVRQDSVQDTSKLNQEDCDSIPRFAYEMEELTVTTNLPRSIYCPITNMPMRDPVILVDGFSYEREAILNWFKYKKTSPSTGIALKSCVIITNHALRSTIRELIVH